MNFDVNTYLPLWARCVILTVGIGAFILVFPITAWAIAVNGDWHKGMWIMTIVYACLIKEKLVEWFGVKPK